MSEDIRKDRIVGIGGKLSHVNYEELKKGLENNKNKSPFANFFNSLKAQKDSTDRK